MILQDYPHCAGRLSPIKVPKKTRSFPVRGQTGVQKTEADGDGKMSQERRTVPKKPLRGPDVTKGGEYLVCHVN